jgi:maltooligosyltrehalose trehalohydrolase
MPVAQFTGERNWGYDGVYPFAVQESYGGRRAARLGRRLQPPGVAVVLYVVYTNSGRRGTT